MIRGRICRLMSSKSSSPSVACLIIGDEILNGKTLDTNSNYVLNYHLNDIIDIMNSLQKSASMPVWL